MVLISSFWLKQFSALLITPSLRVLVPRSQLTHSVGHTQWGQLYIKFRFFKATKFEKILSLFWNSTFFQIFLAFSKYLNFNISFFIFFSEAKSASRRKKSRFLLTIFVSTQAANCASTVRDFVNWYLPKIVTIIPREFSAWSIRTRIIWCASMSTPSSWLNYLPTTKTEWLSFFLRSSIQTVRLVMCTVHGEA